MDLSIFSLLIWDTIPAGLTFNQFGVAQSSLDYVFKYNKLEVKLSICAINGIWGGAYNIRTNLWGCGSGISRDYDFTFKTFEECAKYLWLRVLSHVTNNKSNVLKELERLKSTFEKWCTLNTEDKMKWFKVNYRVYDTV